MEARDLYTKDGKPTGEIIFKGEKPPYGRYIQVVMVLIQNSSGNLLIQKRAKNKNGKFACTSGHPKSGESIIQGMITEIKEELGLDFSEKELKLVHSKIIEDEHIIVNLYYAKRDINLRDIKLQKEEVDSVYWLTLEQIDKLRSDGRMLEKHATNIDEIIGILNNQTKYV